MKIGLVSCSKSKRDEAAKPADLYMESAFFRKARAYVETYHDSWYILSAKHRLLDPDGSVIDPYDDTLSGASVDRQKKGAHTVLQQLQETNLLTDGNRLVLHAGRDYYDELLPLFDESPVEVETPTDGLRYPRREIFGLIFPIISDLLGCKRCELWHVRTHRLRD